MRITIVGTGYVGLVTGACFSEMGNIVYCVDHDIEKIKGLQSGSCPIYEPNLKELIDRNLRQSHLYFTADLQEALLKCDLCFIAVGTPMKQDGSADLHFVYEVAKQIGSIMNHDLLIVNKSTVPVGTASSVLAIIQRELQQRGVSFSAKVASNPEFLKEGSAIEDCMRPDRIVIGASDEASVQLLKAIYAPFIRNHDRFIVMDINSAEMTKYAANAMLATRISFINEIACICDEVNADINMVRRGIGSDSRIGYSFLYAGCGYGGSCFPKDLKALINLAQNHGCRASILESVDAVNNSQKLVLVKKIIKRFGDSLKGLTFAVWGLAFKPETDDIREAPSLVVLQELLSRGASVKAYDPKANSRVLDEFPNSSEKLEFKSEKYSAVEDADAIVLVTEWKEFRSPDFERMKKLMKTPILFDGRNQYNRQALSELGFEYYQIGHSSK